MREQWWQFRSYNSETRYGYGTRDEAERYAAMLTSQNRDPTINVWAHEPIQDAELIGAFDSGSRSDGISLAEEV